MVEKQEHMWLCKTKRAKPVHLLSAIDRHLTKQHTNKRLRKEIIDCITNWANCRYQADRRTVQKIGMEKVRRGYIPAGGPQENQKNTGAKWA
jgi:hypothetical protein